VIVDLHVLVRDLCNEFVLFKDKATVRAAPMRLLFWGRGIDFCIQKTSRSMSRDVSFHLKLPCGNPRITNVL